MKEIKHDAFLQSIGTVVEVPHKVRGSYWTVGCPMKFFLLHARDQERAAPGRAHRRGAA